MTVADPRPQGVLDLEARRVRIGSGARPADWPAAAELAADDRQGTGRQRIDAAEEAGVAPVVSVEVETDGSIVVADQGPGLAPKIVASLVDYSKRTSSRAAYVESNSRRARQCFADAYRHALRARRRARRDADRKPRRRPSHRLHRRSAAPDAARRAYEGAVRGKNTGPGLRSDRRSELAHWSTRQGRNFTTAAPTSGGSTRT